MKKLLGYKPSHFLLFLILGICCQYFGGVWCLGVNSSFCLLLSLLVGAFFLRKTILFTSLVLCWFFLIGAVVMAHSDVRKNQRYYGNYLIDNSTSLLRITKVLKTGNFNFKYTAEVTRINDQKTVGDVLVNIQKGRQNAQLGVDDLLLVSTSFESIKPAMNPHQFSYKNYLAKQGIHHQIFLQPDQFILVESDSKSLLGISAMVRQKIQNSLVQYRFSSDELSVINALLLGQRQDLTDELRQAYTKAGAIHILAVSGLHVGIITWMLSFLLIPLKRGKYGKFITLFAMVCFLWLFALTIGMSASVVRSVSMFTGLAFGQFLNKRNAIEQSLIFSMFVLLLLKPLFLFDIGFQLSYLAVFGIIWIQPPLYSLWKPKFYVMNKAWQILTVSVSAQLGLLPVSLYYFHQFPGLFLLSNLMIIPFLGIILGLGIIVVVLAYTSLLPQFLADLFGDIISVLNWIVDLIARQESFLLTMITFSGLRMIASYLLIALGFQFMIKKNVKRLQAFLCTIILFQCLCVYEKYTVENRSEFVVFHKSRNTVVGLRKGRQLELYHDMDSLSATQQRFLKSYKIGEHIEYSNHSFLPNVFYLKKQPILLVDNEGIYHIKDLHQPVVVLQHSPKINLDRLIYVLNPLMIVADGSNYSSSISHWEATCLKTKTLFWSTNKKGAFVLKETTLN